MNELLVSAFIAETDVRERSRDEVR